MGLETGHNRPKSLWGVLAAALSLAQPAAAEVDGVNIGMPPTIAREQQDAGLRIERSKITEQYRYETFLHWFGSHTDDPAKQSYALVRSQIPDADAGMFSVALKNQVRTALRDGRSAVGFIATEDEFSNAVADEAVILSANEPGVEQDPVVLRERMRALAQALSRCAMYWMTQVESPGR
jgi:hypothetical protein